MKYFSCGHSENNCACAFTQAQTENTIKSNNKCTFTLPAIIDAIPMPIYTANSGSIITIV